MFFTARRSADPLSLSFMASFLRKLKKQGVDQVEDAEKGGAEAHVMQGVAQLDVDVYQTDSEIVIYAPMAGAGTESIDVSIEGDNDIITISGSKARPENLAFESGRTHKGQFFSEEAAWGDFYRQIILPEEIDIGGAEAKMRNGVLVLTLPLLRSSSKKTKMKILKLDES